MKLLKTLTGFITGVFIALAFLAYALLLPTIWAMRSYKFNTWGWK